MSHRTTIMAALRLSTAAGNERVAMAAAAAAGRLAGLSPERLADLRTVVAEACLNAFEHGNSNRPDLPVYLTFTSRAGGFRVLVRDRGPGFQLAGPTPPSLEYLLAGGSSGRGWGLWLIKQLADRVQVRQNRRGCSVILDFNLEDEVTAS
ncbi:MAG: serine/threonine-protein kinase RsbW [Moorella sp. (in: firmicutes)]|nr:serine/threonine-protein kinase RsbW [Moorella sp. (in: firmicutes)]